VGDDWNGELRIENGEWMGPRKIEIICDETVSSLFFPYLFPKSLYNKKQFELEYIFFDIINKKKEFNADKNGI